MLETVKSFHRVANPSPKALWVGAFCRCLGHWDGSKATSMIIPSYRTFPRAETTPVSSLQTFSWSLLYFSLEIFLEYLKIFPLLYFSLEPLTPHKGWNPHMAPWCPWWQMPLTQVLAKHLFTTFPRASAFTKAKT